MVTPSRPDPAALCFSEKREHASVVPRHALLYVAGRDSASQLADVGIDLAVVRAAWRVRAGQLARVALLIASSIDTARVRHRCTRWEGCQVSGLDLVDFAEQLAAEVGPSLEVACPVQDAREFRQGLKTALSKVIDADRAPMPTALLAQWQPIQRALLSVAR